LLSVIQCNTIKVRDEEDRMNQEERAAFEQMTDLETILGAGFLLTAEDAEKARAGKADELEVTK
jgi:hypothetical protein